MQLATKDLIKKTNKSFIYYVKSYNKYNYGMNICIYLFPIRLKLFQKSKVVFALDSISNRTPLWC